MYDLLDDMDDEQELRALRERQQKGASHVTALIGALEFLESIILKEFQTDDREALRHQDQYRTHYGLR